MKLPIIHPRKLNQALARIGWEKHGQKGGEHIKYKEGHPNPITVPYHGAKDLKPGTLRHILKDAGVSRQEFLRLLGRKGARRP